MAWVQQIEQHDGNGKAQVRRWEVDLDAARAVASWAKRRMDVLEHDLSGMAQYFPHWLLAGCRGQKPAYCARCHQIMVPAKGAIRCLHCNVAGEVDGLLWVGQLPVLARSEGSFARKRAALVNAGFAETTVQGLVYLLVPVTVVCPSEWPNVEPAVFYSPKWLQALGLPLGNGSYHLLHPGRACLFAWGQWWAMGVHEVLQQRVVNHATSLFKIAAGMSPEEAFIGRIHHAEWRPEVRR